jgi:hypothetical protein
VSKAVSTHIFVQEMEGLIEGTVGEGLTEGTVTAEVLPPQKRREKEERIEESQSFQEHLFRVKVTQAIGVWYYVSGTSCILNLQ